MRYVLSDLHGEYDGFMAMLEQIGFCSNDVMYILGDVIDRGKKPIYLLEYISKQDNMEMVLGNHEDVFLSYLSTGKRTPLDMWENNGGDATLYQYEMLSQDRKNNILNYLQTRPMYKILDKFILVHAGINTEKIHGATIDEIMKSQEQDDLFWIRSEFYRKPALAGLTVIFGHTPTPMLHGKYSIWHDEKYRDKIGIDCGVAYGGKIGCLRLDDMAEFYV